jgi:hypothetical protein
MQKVFLGLEGFDQKVSTCFNCFSIFTYQHIFCTSPGQKVGNKQPSMVAAQKNQESCPEVASLNSACLAKEKGLQMGSVKMGPSKLSKLG